MRRAKLFFDAMIVLAGVFMIPFTYFTGMYVLTVSWLFIVASVIPDKIEDSIEMNILALVLSLIGMALVFVSLGIAIA